MSKEYPLYKCPITKCENYVLDDEGHLWTCPVHGMQFVKMKTHIVKESKSWTS